MENSNDSSNEEVQDDNVLDLNIEDTPEESELEKNEESEPSFETKVSELEEENSKLKNEFLYLRAEFENFRKQSIKERSQLIKYGPERLVVKLLDVLDIFDKALAMDVNSDNLKSFVDGINMTSSELYSVLSSFNIEKVDSLGKAFNPNTHEALGSEETDKIEPGHISQVFKSPYKFNDKIIRHGQVVIAKELSTPPKEEDSDTSNA